MVANFVGEKGSQDRYPESNFHFWHLSLHTYIYPACLDTLVPIPMNRNFHIDLLGGLYIYTS